MQYIHLPTNKIVEVCVLSYVDLRPVISFLHDSFLNTSHIQEAIIGKRLRHGSFIIKTENSIFIECPVSFNKIYKKLCNHITDDTPIPHRSIGVSSVILQPSVQDTIEDHIYKSIIAVAVILGIKEDIDITDCIETVSLIRDILEDYFDTSFDEKENPTHHNNRWDY